MSKQETAVQSEKDVQKPDSDSRARVRHRCQIAAYYRGKRGSSELGWMADVRDISATGIGLTLSRRFDVGVLLFVELTSTIDESAHLLPVTVAHATEAEEGRWILGCTFSRALTNAELAELVLDAPRGRVFA